MTPQEVKTQELLIKGAMTEMPQEDQDKINSIVGALQDAIVPVKDYEFLPVALSLFTIHTVQEGIIDA